MSYRSPVRSRWPGPDWTPGRGAVRAAAAWFLIIVIVTSVEWFVWPTSSYPAHADAILVLNGNDNRARAELGIRLAERKVAPVLLYSLGGYRAPSEYPPYCPEIPAVRVVCFTPDPARTVGEVSYAERYARSHGMTSIVIVAGHSQGTRAALLARRCFTGRSYVADASEPWSQVPFEVTYEWGAITKALFIDTGC